MDLSNITIFLGGIATVFTPCILPVLPVYLGIFGASPGKSGRGGILAQTVVFGAGFSILFILMGMGAASISSFLISYKSILAAAGGIIIIFMGLIFSGAIKIPFLMQEYKLGDNFIRQDGKSGYITSFFAGIVFAAGWSPCAGPILGSVLTYVALKSSDFLSGAILMGIYSLGIVTPFIFLSLFAERLLPKIKALYSFIPIIQKAGGILLIAGGLLLLYYNFDSLSRFYNYDKPQKVTEFSISEKPQLLFILSRHCPECKKLHKILPDIINDCKNMDIDISETYLEDDKEISTKYNVNVVPTIILLDSNRREIKRVFGYQDIYSLRVAAASILNKNCAGESPDINNVKSSSSMCTDKDVCKEDKGERFQ